MRHTALRGGVLFLTLMLFSVLAAGAAERPTAVSPGSPTGSLTGDACPTFSWAAAEGAVAHELVVYQVREAGQEATPVLKQAMPSSASSWTPSLDRCLEGGGRYAWSVRQVDDTGDGQWSDALLFAVAGEPTIVEVQAALDLLNRYLAAKASQADSAIEPNWTARESSAQGFVSPSPVSVAPLTRSGRESPSLGPTNPSLVLDNGMVFGGGLFFETAPTRKLHLLPTEFVPTVDDFHIDLTGGQLFVKTSAPAGTSVAATLHLPVGAMITKFECHLIDGSASHANACALWRATGAAAGSTLQAEADTGVEEIFQGTRASDPLIDNLPLTVGAEDRFSVGFFPLPTLDCGNQCLLNGVTITYTVEQVD